MGILSTASIVGIAIRAIDNGIDLWKRKTPDWKTKQEYKMINKYQYMKDLYEIEKKKPRYDDSKTEAENKNARSTDRMLNLRDQLLSYGSEITEKLRSN